MEYYRAVLPSPQGGQLSGEKASQIVGFCQLTFKNYGGSTYTSTRHNKLKVINNLTTNTNINAKKSVSLVFLSFLLLYNQIQQIPKFLSRINSFYVRLYQLFKYVTKYLHTKKYFFFFSMTWGPLFRETCLQINIFNTYGVPGFFLQTPLPFKWSLKFPKKIKRHHT